MDEEENYEYQENYDDYNYDDQYQQYNPNYDDPYDVCAEEYYMEEEPAIDYTSRKEYEVLPYKELFTEVRKHLKTANEMTALAEGWCLLLLREFKWDVDLLSEYFQDIEKYRKKIGYNPKYTNPNQVEQTTGPCDVCCSQYRKLYLNICGHGYCQPCWRSHLQTRIFGNDPFVKCMQCMCPVLLETILYFLQKFYPFKRKMLDTYEKLISEKFSTIHRNYQFCTGADCGNCIKVYNLNLRSVKCSCGKVFCFKCKSDDHSPCTCEQKKLWTQNVMKEEADAKWMSMHTKLCPWCKKAVQRSAGCNFMACVCGKNFCYLCSRPWQPDHKDHFKCHIYKKSSNQQISRQKQILEKMNFYTERYLDNQATAINNKRIDTFEQRKLLFKVLKIDLSDSQFIDTAYKFSIECCECLKWIYAYSYYAKWKNTIDEESFKFDQGEFEKYKVNLLKMLAVDLKSFIQKVRQYDEAKMNSRSTQEKFVEEFKELKKNIVNYFTMTKKYKEKFIDEIQNRNEDLPMGIIKKKSSTILLDIKISSEQKKDPKNKPQHKEKPSSNNTKVVTRSSAQKQKSPQQANNKAKGFFSKYF